MLRLFNNVEKSEPSRLPEPPTKTASNDQQRFACCEKAAPSVSKAAALSAALQHRVELQRRIELGHRVALRHRAAQATRLRG